MSFRFRRGFSRRVASAELVVALLLTLIAARESEACDCDSKFANSFRERLVLARQSYERIYRGRYTPIPNSGKVAFTVIEGFQGASKGQRFETDGSNCSMHLLPDKEYLVFGDGSMCTPTRPVAPADLEVEFLRTGKLPAEPMAVRKHVVTCTDCFGNRFANQLIGYAEDGGDSDWTSGFGVYDMAERADAGVAFRGRPHSSQVPVSDGRGRFFEILEQQRGEWWTPCSHRVDVRRCAGFDFSTWRPAGLRPMPSETVCDSSRDRREAVERLQRFAGSCRWWLQQPPWQADCSLTEAAGEPVPGGPVMDCYPMRVSRGAQQHCEIIQPPSQAPAPKP